MPTLGRLDEIVRLFDSLKAQTFRDFELIIVDQNEHHEVEKLVESYKTDVSIVYIRSAQKGLSLNRNIGLRKCKGDIIAFPDDDCWYRPDVLKTVDKTFFDYPGIAFCTLPVYDIINKDDCYIAPSKQMLHKPDIFKYCISFNFFIKRNTCIEFDVRLGVGAKYGSGEETDYLYASIGKGKVGIFVNESGIHHLKSRNYMTKERAYKYGLGFGAVFKKDMLQRKNKGAFFVFVYYLLKSFAGTILYPSRFGFYWETFKGRLCGFITFRLNP
jgi:glycosyltransferase involved in cell wall biosynthesis